MLRESYGTGKIKSNWRGIRLEGVKQFKKTESCDRKLSKTSGRIFKKPIISHLLGLRGKPGRSFLVSWNVPDIGKSGPLISRITPIAWVTPSSGGHAPALPSIRAIRGRLFCAILEIRGRSSPYKCEDCRATGKKGIIIPVAGGRQAALK
jgi:hypothetical protein